MRDTVRCGAGRDRVKADRRDRLRGCEVVATASGLVRTAAHKAPPVATTLARLHRVEARKEALEALAEIGPLLRELAAEVAWHGPPRWRGSGPELGLKV
jgi:hypothetical protein